MQKKQLLPIAALVLAACSQNPASSTTAAPTASACLPSNLIGGYRIQEEVTPEARRAVEVVLVQLNSSAKLAKIQEVRTQVVAGTNYALTFKLENEQVWHAIVWRDLQGNYTITQAASQTPFAAMCRE